mmetsp:Transcript_115520/g.373232  ORF Transcript_115520/g.373232 Transcript_115520/m.373232 type:complete len:209 (-) Transcript_115520:230-856(-)
MLWLRRHSSSSWPQRCRSSLNSLSRTSAPFDEFFPASLAPSAPPGGCRPREVSQQLRQASTPLKGWKATAGASQGKGCWPQCSSLRRLNSSTRLTASSWRQWSRNQSSPQCNGRRYPQRGRPLAKVSMAPRERTSSGPCRPKRQLFRYMASPSARERMGSRPSSPLRRAGRNTESGSAFAVQPWRLNLPSRTTARQTRTKTPVFSAVR